MNIRTARPLRRIGAVAALATVFGTAFGAATAAPALAHTRLVSSDPAKGATISGVTEVALVFSDKISVAKVVVTDGAGKAFQNGAAVRAGTKVTQKLTGALPAGAYTVAYRVVGADGHPIEKSDLTFTAASGPAGAVAPSTEPAPGGGPVSDQQTGDAATKDEQPLPQDIKDAEEKDESGSGMIVWILVGAGALVGIGIGVGIVLRAKRKAGPSAAQPSAGAGEQENAKVSGSGE